MKKKTKRLIWGSLFLTVAIGVVQPTNPNRVVDAASSKKEMKQGQYKGKLEVKSIKEPVELHKSGMTRGKFHDRQDLGIILQKNTTLKIRQTNEAYKKNLKVRLLGDDRKIEKDINVGSEWVTVREMHDLVPFVDTPFDSEGAILEYEIDAKETVLPIYDGTTKSEDFMNVWDKEKSSYALMKDEKFQMLIPKKDKELVRAMKGFDSIDAYMAYIDSVFVTYNKLAGLDDSLPIHEAGKNRFFLKADASGPGGAYYGVNWTANSKNTVDIFLKEPSWGTLHEFGHGYQTSLDGKGIYTGEVFNNIFANHYLYEKYGKKADDFGFLFNGNKKRTEKRLFDKLDKNNGTYHSVDVREKLILQVMMKQKAGDQAFTELYKGYRSDANTKGFNANTYFLPDEMNRYYSEYSHFDFTPLLERWGVVLKNNQPIYNREKGYKPVASLADVVPESDLTRAHQVLDSEIEINSNYQVVDNSQVAKLGLKGNLVIELKAEEAEALEGLDVFLKEGKTVVQKSVVKNGKAEFKEVNNGIYQVEFNGPKFNQYVQSNDYVYVKEAENHLDMALNKINVSQSANQEIQFLGISSKMFATFKTNLNKEEATLSVLSNKPHYYFPGKVYAKVKVSDADGNVKYERSLEGTDVKTGEDTFSLKEGDQLEIFHEETKNRLTSSENILNKGNKTNTFIMTKWGLHNLNLKNNDKQEFLSRLENDADTLLSDNKLNKIKFSQSTAKKNVLVGINSLEEPLKSQYLEKYTDILLSNKADKGESFDFIFKGISNNEFSKVRVSLEDKKATVKTNNGKPHYYFSDKTYASFLIHDKEGNKKYDKEFIGTKNDKQSKEDISIEVGDYITAHHLESKDRLVIQNLENALLLETKQTVTYQVTETGLKQVDTQTIPNIVSRDGQSFTYGFKGLGNKEFATFDVSIENKSATIEIKQGKPHSYFSNQTYASVFVQDKDGMLKYEQEFIGTKNYKKGKETISIDVGDYITVHHQEFEDRLEIKNNKHDLLLEKNQTMTYQVTETGLVQVDTQEIPNINPNEGQSFTYQFKGLSNREFATLDVSIENKSATVETKSGQPHSYFPNKTYAAIVIQDKNGKTKYEKEYIGANQYTKEKEDISIEPGDYITVHHGESKDRLEIKNNKHGLLLNKEQTITYQVEEKGLKQVPIQTIPNLRSEEGKSFTYQFKGLGNNDFAKLDISLENNLAVIETKNKKPHSYFVDEVYASITIFDKKGNVKYEKEFIGNKNYESEKEEVSIEKGDYVTVHHEEFKNRLAINNDRNDLQLDTRKNITYILNDNRLNH